MDCYDSLPGIRFIGYISAAKNQLPKNLYHRYISGDDIALNFSAEKIDFCGTPQLSQESQITSKGASFKTELSFQTQSRIALLPAGCFYVVDVVGNEYIIGVGERPHPIVSVTKQNGNTSERNVYSYNVSSVYPLIKLLPTATTYNDDEAEL